MINELVNISPIAKGGQKEVFSAEHAVHGNVVLKKISPSPDGYERTKREIRAVALMNSPFIPKIIAHNCDEDNPDPIWIVEPRISGSNLREVLKTGRIFNIHEIVIFLETMLSIAIESENNNLVHRDIKPENIIFDDDDNFWLLDFGIARHLDLESITNTNEPFGVFTLGYASSEQFRNMKSLIDIRADLFSIGVVCFEMLKGINFYVTGTNNDVYQILKKLENSSLPPLRIQGDPQFQLSTFIKLVGDHRRTRRPRTAAEAKLIFDTLKSTLVL